MSKHTPGPWVMWGKADPSQVIAANGGPFVGQTIGGNDEANARLIAAAPELLEALQLAASIIGHPDDAASKHIAAVIAKATGGES